MRWLALVFLCACEAVPDITYVADDASVPPDGGNTCPMQVPAYATSCCGPIPCLGASCTATCTDCTAKCTLDDLCCPNAQDRATCNANLKCP